jgi:prevent-host-death family protein
MERATVRDLHLKTSELIRNVASGQTYIIEKSGKPVAVLRPAAERPGSGKRLPNREAYIKTLPKSKTDMGRIMEQDRS